MGYEINNLYRASYLELPKNKSRERLSREVEGLFTTVEILLIFRMIFTYFDILPPAIESALMSISYPLVAIFHTLTGTTPLSGAFDWTSLFAFSFFSVLGFIVVKITRSNIV